jgi:AraC-like DNA-binding protein
MTLLSSKLDLIARDGYALAASRQPGYAFRWHTHDCAMLLWPRAGALLTAWGGQEDGSAGFGSVEQGPLQDRLVKGQALLLPAHVAHRTRSGSALQQHGELYLAPEWVQAWKAGGVLQLDGAAQAMLDALWMPALSARAAPGLVHALIAQLAGSRIKPAVAAPPAGLAQRWHGLLQARLADGGALPTVAESASLLGVTMRTLQRACLAQFGQTPVALRRSMLAAVARTHLAAGASLAQVSAELGFANSGHLGRLLRDVPVAAAQAPDVPHAPDADEPPPASSPD